MVKPLALGVGSKERLTVTEFNLECLTAGDAHCTCLTTEGSVQSKPFSITTPVEKVKKRCGVSRWKTASRNLCRFTHKGCVAPVALSAFEVELISTFEPAPRVLFFPLSHAGLGNNRWHFELHEEARAALQSPLERMNERKKGEGRMALFFFQLSTRKERRLFPRCCCCCCWQAMTTKCPLVFFQHTLFSAKRETNLWVETAKRCCCFASGKATQPFFAGKRSRPGGFAFHRESTGSAGLVFR